jgi:hypothetical protein
MKRACVFVDGENFRHSLKQLFHNGRYSFGKGDYLPETDWHAFFTSLANRFECELLRVYWYVIEHIDYRPYRVPHEWGAKERVLARWYAEQIEACAPEVGGKFRRVSRITTISWSFAGPAASLTSWPRSSSGWRRALIRSLQRT